MSAGPFSNFLTTFLCSFSERGNDLSLTVHFCVRITTCANRWCWAGIVTRFEPEVTENWSAQDAFILALSCSLHAKSWITCCTWLATKGSLSRTSSNETATVITKKPVCTWEDQGNKVLQWPLALQRPPYGSVGTPVSAHILFLLSWWPAQFIDETKQMTLNVHYALQRLIISFQNP